MEMMRLKVGDYGEYCYIVSEEEKGRALIFDPGGHPDEIIDYIDNNGLKPVAILITHGHHDHISGLEEVRDYYRVPVYMHPLDVPKLALAGQREPDILIEETGKVYSIDGFKVRMEHVPGHSAGSVIYFFDDENFAICGDVIFKGSVGRTDFEDGDFETLMRGIERYLSPLPDDFILMPGHAELTTIGEEKKENSFLNGHIQFKHGKFVWVEHPDKDWFKHQEF